MKKRILSVFLILAMLTGLFAVLPVVVVADTPTVWDGSTAAAFAGGDGTEANPYQISNGAELKLLQSKIATDAANYYNKSYKLTADIVLNTGDATTWGTSAPANNFETGIGAWSDATSSFGGHFDGDGHTISGFYMKNGGDGQGLFACIQGGAVIEKFALVNAYVEGTSAGAIGSVIGQTDRANGSEITVRNVYAEATVVCSGDDEVGGIIGNLTDSKDAYTAGKVTVDRATFVGSVRGTSFVAGLIGNIRSVAVDVKNCLVYANVTSTQSTGNRYAAGFACRSTAGVEGKDQTFANCILAGGSVSCATSGSKRNRAYVSSSSGTNKPSVTDCYDIVGVTDCYNADDSDCEDISVNQLYGFYAGAGAIDWATWGSTNWASKSLDIMRPAGVAENFDIIPFTIGELETGASVRMSDPTGLRFTAAIDQDDLAMFASVTGYGIVIAPTSYVEAAGAFTMAALDNLAVAEGSKYLKIEAEKLVEDTAEHVVFSAVIGNIKAANYAVDFSAIVYVEADGAVYYSAYNATANSRSIRDVATAAFNDRSATQVNEYQYEVAENDYSPYTEAQRAVLASFMA